MCTVQHITHDDSLTSHGPRVICPESLVVVLGQGARAIPASGEAALDTNNSSEQRSDLSGVRTRYLGGSRGPHARVR